MDSNFESLAATASSSRGVVKCLFPGYKSRRGLELNQDHVDHYCYQNNARSLLTRCIL